ncbi:MAG: hypothetical protein JXA98_06335 [Methanosarcinaceae archaeon]|nr:hypothetical protein [Methanosarcinaceae archaeon]
MDLWTVTLAVFMLNIPFGYWRANVRKFTLQWFLSVHVPVPVIIAFRIFAGLGWQLITFSLLVGAFFSGQLLGGRLHMWRMRYSATPVTSSLIRDMVTTSHTFKHPGK